MGKRRQVNIPVFIPHLGCPNDCVFCNQKTISGHAAFSVGSVREEIERALATVPRTAESDVRVEIAFFGGSFTGIGRREMTDLLDIAGDFVARGRADAIRLSTRPDYIDPDILDLLGRYPVETIELGLQSFSDRVLAASRRGHTAAQSEEACRMILEKGFSLVGQMMLGLPLSSREDDSHTARRICELGCSAARVYPTAVLKHTRLAEMAKSGEYLPLSLDEAVRRAADALEIFHAHQVPVIRVGLCTSELLQSEIACGVCHPAVGELAQSEVWLRILRKKLDALGDLTGKSITLHVPRGATSRVIGQKRKNKLQIEREYTVKSVSVIENDIFSEYTVSVDVHD